MEALIFMTAALTADLLAANRLITRKQWGQLVSWRRCQCLEPSWGKPPFTSEILWPLLAIAFLGLAMGQSKGIALQHSTPAMNSLQLCGKNQTSPATSISAFLKGEKQPVAICYYNATAWGPFSCRNSWKSQQEDGTRVTDSLQDQGAVHTMRSQVCLEISCGSPSFPPPRCLLSHSWSSHSACGGLTGLNTGNYVTPRLECHLLHHHHRCLWQCDDGL